MQFRFVCEQDSEYDEGLGWRLVSQPEFRPGPGVTVAHDCLEHFTISPLVSDELLAFGGILYVRGDEYYSRRNKACTNPGIHLAYDLVDVVRHAHANGGMPRFIRAHRSKHGDRVEEWIDSMFMEYGKIAEISISTREQDTIRNYMRVGYKLLKMRYGGAMLVDLFMDIEDQADKLLREAEIGVEMNVKVNFKRRVATCDIVQPDEDKGESRFV